MSANKDLRHFFSESEFSAGPELRLRARKLEDELLTRPAGPVQVTGKSQLKALRHSNTMLKKAKRKLEREAKRHRAGLRVIKWAVRFVKGSTDWNEQQLVRAVSAFERIES